MRKKNAFLIIVILINCNIMGVAWRASVNEDVKMAINKEWGCVVVEAAETETVKEKKSSEIANNAESLTGQSEEESESSGDVISNELDRKELGETSGDVEKEENRFEEGAEEQELKTEEENQEIDGIYNVSLPADTRVYLDPDNLSGRGQIFSDEFKVENYGNTDVAIKIKNIEVYYQSTEEIYELSEEEVTDNHSYVKKLNVDIVWKNKEDNTEKILNVIEGISDEKVLELKASEYDEDGNFIELNQDSIGSFYFTGSMNANPALKWNDGEVIVSFDYEIVDVEEKQKAQKDTDDGEEDMTHDVKDDPDK